MIIRNQTKLFENYIITYEMSTLFKLAETSHCNIVRMLDTNFLLARNVLVSVRLVGKGFQYFGN